MESVESGLAVRPWMGDGLLLVDKSEIIEICLLLVGVASGGAVGGVIFGSSIVGRECVRVFVCCLHVGAGNPGRQYMLFLISLTLLMLLTFCACLRPSDVNERAWRGWQK